MVAQKSFLAARAAKRPRRGWVGLAIALLLIGTTVAGAAASKGWCRTDPVVLIDGAIADIFVSAPLTAPLQVTGPTEVVVTVPVGVETAVVLTDLGFGRGETVTFKESKRLRRTAEGVQVKVAVRVPARDDAMPVRVEFAPRILGILWPDSAEGTANDWVVLRSTI
jgi:hypothetical protein